MVSIVISALALSAIAASGQESSRPRITPFFSGSNAAPAFFVECRNGGRRVPSSSNIWAWAPDHLRVDGKPFVETRGIIGPGLSSSIEPGETWRGIITLHQASGADAPAVAFGAHVRGGRVVPLSAGRHSLAVHAVTSGRTMLSFIGSPPGSDSVPTTT